MPRDEVEVEVLQLIRPHHVGRPLRRPRGVAFRMRHQLGRNLCRQDRLQHRVGRLVKLPGRHHPPDQVLDERLAHRAVHVVVRHVVADPVGHPAQRQLAQVARPQHQRVVLVGQPEQVRCPLPRLHILKRYVI